MNSGLHQKVTNFENEIVSVKLLTADRIIIELIGRVASSNEKSLWLINPQLLRGMVVKNKKGENEEVVGMVNFMVSGDQSEPVEIQKVNVLAMSKTAKEAASEYVRLTTNLVTPTTPGLVV